MRRIPLRFVLVLAGAALLMVLFGIERAWRPSQAAAYRMMVASAAAAPTVEERKLLQRIVETVARLKGDLRSVQVNGSFGSDHINVALLPFQGSPASLSLPNEGFVSLPPTVLAVDLGAFRSILLQAFNDSLYFAQAVGEMQRLSEKPGVTDEDVTAAGMKYGALSLQLRLANFSNSAVAGKYAPMMVSALQAFEVDQDFYLAFIFPIAHELFHLRTNASVGMDIAAEELAADRFAAATATAALQVNRDNGRLPMRFQLLLVGVRFYQDRLLQTVFEGLRGLGAQSLLVGFAHAPCKAALELPWPLRFNNPDVVVEGWPLRPPVLSDDEVALVLARLDTFSRRNHPHLLMRIDQLRKVIASEPDLGTSASGLDFSEELLKLYTERAASVEMLDWLPTEAVGRKQVADILRRLHLVKEQVTARGCDYERCITAKAGPGYVDILANGGQIRSLTIAEPMTDPHGVGALMAAVEEFAGRERMTEVMLPIGAALKECRVASDSLRLGDYGLNIRTMNEAGWIEARFFSISR